jgi:hypothetical protein
MERRVSTVDFQYKLHVGVRKQTFVIPNNINRARIMEPRRKPLELWTISEVFDFAIASGCPKTAEFLSTRDFPAKFIS